MLINSLSLIFGYLCGSIPFGFIYIKLAGYGDIREQGSGNIGATNVLRTGNKLIAFMTLLSDCFKGYVAVYFLQKVLSLPSFDIALLLTALGALLGHLFPIWLRFKGGKGVATALGVLFALYWPIALAVLFTWLLFARVTKISSLSALIACLLCPAYAIITYQWEFVGLCVLFFILISFMHRENISRLLQGTEPRIGQ